MRILDRYLLRRYAHAYVISFTSLLGLYLVIDAFTNLDEFSEQTNGIAAVLQHMAGYYVYRVSLFFDRMAGLVGMLAAVFTLSWMERQRELTPLLAAGISLYRVAAPVMLAACAMSGVQVANQELVIPRIRDRLFQDADDLTGNKAHVVDGCYDNQTGIFIGGQHAYAQERRISQARLILPVSVAETLTLVEAENAYYVEAQGSQPGGWKLVRTKPAVIPVRAESSELLQPLLGGKPGQYFLRSLLSFDQVARRRQWYQFASTAELIELLRNPSLSNSLDQAVVVHTRIVRPILNLLLLLLSMPLAMTRERRNMFLSMGVVLLVSAAFVATMQVCRYLGNLGLPWFPPALAAWAPVIIFGSLSAALFDRAAT